MPFKPMPKRKFQKWIQGFGWTLKKGKIDWNVYDENGIFVCSVVVQHPGENNVIAHSVKKVETELRERGLIR